MPADDRDERPAGPPSEFASEPPGESYEPAAPEGEDEPPARRRRRFINRRNAVIVGVVLGVSIFLLIIVALILFRTGQVDRIVERQIRDTLAQYNIRAEIEGFQLQLGARTAVFTNMVLYDSVSGAQLARINRLEATIRIEELYALRLSRDVNLERLVIDGLEAWVVFDEEGRSNFRNIVIPDPDPNRRILFSYSTAQVEVTNSVIHYADERYEIAGTARNIRATVMPDDPNAPAESWMNQVHLSLSDSTFTYNGNPVNNISVEARARVSQERAEIHELILRSPLAESRLTGVMDDWRELRYRFDITSTVDLTQTSQLLQTDAALRGVGQFVGRVEGTGTRYQVDGEVQSDAIAADGVRLQGLNVTLRGGGEGSAYEAQGRMVAELLTSGDFRLSMVQVAGGVMGTGTDFRWVGELRAAGLRSGGLNIASLMVSDAVAEYRDGQITATAARAGAGSLATADARVNAPQVSGVRVTSTDEGTNITAESASAGSIVAGGATVSGAAATGIEATERGGTTNVTVAGVRLGSVVVPGTASTGSINIAGVRLAIQENGRIEGSSGDINVGTVTLQAAGGGRAEDVRLARPVFTVEPAGRYRVSADLSLGGGVLGEMNLGAARAGVVAVNNQIQLNNFTAEVFGGRAAGNATISTARGLNSRVAAEFSELDIAALVAATTGRVVPVAGEATGTVNLTFPGTDFSAASGTVDAQLQGEAGTEAAGRSPLNGTVALRADRGLFVVDRAELRAGATQLTAAGQFSLTRDSDLQVNLTSSDAGELQRLIVSLGLAPTLDDMLADTGVQLAGNLDFRGNVRGRLTEPTVDGRLSLDPLIVNRRDLGALTASINLTPAELSIPDGRLAERDGGGIQFALNVPFYGANNVSLEATLERANAGNLAAAVPYLNESQRAQLANLGDASGRLVARGLPGAMSGSADLRVGPGRIAGERFEEIIARADLTGSTVTIETLDARFEAGRLTASGTFDTESTRFNLQAQGSNVRLDVIEALTGARPAQVAGTVDFTARAAGLFADTRTYQITLDGRGRDVTINGRPAGDVTLVGRTENGQLDVQFTTGIFGSPQVIAARVDLTSEDLTTTIETSLAGVDLTPLFAALLPEAAVRVAGRATGTIRITGPLFGEDEEGVRDFSIMRLRGTANFTELSVQIEDVRLDAESPLIVQFSGNEILFERTRFTGPGTNIAFGGTAAVAAGGRQNLTVDGELNLRVLNGLSPDIFLTGTSRVAVRLDGTYEDPRLTGTATLAGATFSTLFQDERLTITNIDGLLRFNANQAQIDNLTGRLGGGRLSVTGGALLDGFMPAQFRVVVRADDVSVPLPYDFRSTADAELVVQGTPQASIITGVNGPAIINVRRAEYTENIELTDLIANRRGEGSLSAGGGRGGGAGLFGANTQIDMRIEGRDALVVRNNLADAVGSLSLRVRGTLEEPVVSGRISVTRGTINFRNDRYELTRGYVDLPPQPDADPIINLQAESDIAGYRVVVGLTGELSRLNASLRSEPSLPQADVVALITTGRLATGDESLSTLAQTGVGTAASLLTETLVTAPLRRATERLFGLNRLELDPIISARGGASPTARLTVGRQIDRNLLVTYSTNISGEPNQVIAVEYRLTDRLSFVAQYERGSTRNLAGSDNNFNFEVRLRRRF